MRNKGGRSTRTEHIFNVFTEGELDEKVVVRNFRLTTLHGAIEGKIQEVDVNSIGKRVREIQNYAKSN
jgi:hypothetical protein